MIAARAEPVIRIGLITGAHTVSLALAAPFVASTGEALPYGRLHS